jgi:hypothetical protein
MKTVSILAVVGFLALSSPTELFAGGKGNNGNGNSGNNGNNGKNKTIESVLASAPLPEWPAQAAGFVSSLKGADREHTALAALQYAASTHPATVTSIASALAAVLPASAPTLAADAAKLVPADAKDIVDAVSKAVPQEGDQIAQAVALAVPDSGVVLKNPDNGNRPPLPPGWAKGNTPGRIRGNRPLFPPGQVLDPKPGRDPQRREYGSP